MEPTGAQLQTFARALVTVTMLGPFAVHLYFYIRPGDGEQRQPLRQELPSLAISLGRWLSFGLVFLLSNDRAIVIMAVLHITFLALDLRLSRMKERSRTASDPVPPE